MLNAKSNATGVFSVFRAFHGWVNYAILCKHLPATTLCIRQAQLRRTQFSDICCNYCPTSNNFLAVKSIFNCPTNTYYDCKALVQPQFTHYAHRSFKVELASAILDTRAPARPTDRPTVQTELPSVSSA
jgi:hypothetical protein